MLQSEHLLFLNSLRSLRKTKCAWKESNLRPQSYQDCALPLSYTRVIFLCFAYYGCLVDLLWRNMIHGLFESRDVQSFTNLGFWGFSRECVARFSHECSH